MKRALERQIVSAGMFFLAVFMLGMTIFNEELWGVELFKLLLQAIVITGLINMVLAHHYTKDEGSDEKTNNTARAFDAINAAISRRDEEPSGAPGDPVHTVEDDPK